MLISVLNQFRDNTVSSFLKARLCQYISLIHFLLQANSSHSAQAMQNKTSQIFLSILSNCECSRVSTLYAPSIGFRQAPYDMII